MAGDMLVLTKLDRFARSMADAIEKVLDEKLFYFINEISVLLIKSRQGSLLFLY